MRSTLLLLCGVGCCSGAVVSSYIEYTTSEGLSRGVMTWDDSRCSSSSRCPAVMIVPDWTGIDDYERSRACLLAAQGYVAFVADIYGVERTSAWPATPNTTHYAAAATDHRADPNLFMHKIAKGMERLQAQSIVDTTKIAAIGYCFGATAVLNMALNGYGGQYAGVTPTGLLGVAGFHGSNTGLIDRSTSATSHPKVMLFQGLADGAFTHAALTDLENSLEAGSVSYQITLYGTSVPHGYTVWDDASAYNSYADERSWTNTLRFFEELFVSGGAAATPKPAGGPESPISGSLVNYTCDGITCQGYVSYNTETCTSSSTCPVVLIIQDWTGMTEYEMRRADLIASMGYVAFAADIYGVGTPLNGQQDWAAAATVHSQNTTKYMGKMVAALDRVMQYDFIDSTRMCAIGYCFGGSGLMTLGLLGHQGIADQSFPVGLKGVVGYHAGVNVDLVNQVAAQGASAPTRPKVLMLSGARDSANSPAAMLTLMNHFEAAGDDWEVQRYGPNVQHSFTDWDASNAPGFVYHELSDQRSWSSTRRLFNELFATSSPTRVSQKPSQCTAPSPPSSPAAQRASLSFVLSAVAAVAAVATAM